MAVLIRRADWILLIVVSLYAGRYLASGSLLHTLDGPTHAYRVLEFHRAFLADGSTPRWAPDLVFGYGYPLFNFYAPLTYYLAEVPYRLGADPLLAMNLLCLLSLAAAGTSMYAFARRHLPRLPAFITAVAYVYWPYRLAMLYVRGDVPELIAFAVLPLLLLAFRRLLDTNGDGWLLLSALLLAGMVLTHNLTALLSAAVVFGYVAVTTVWERRRVPWRVVAAFGLGIGLAAYFWLPATIETRWLDQSRIFAADYRAKLVGLPDLIQPYAWDYHYYPRADNLRTPFPVGFAAAVLALLGAASLWFGRGHDRQTKGFLFFSGLLSVASLVGLLEYFSPVLEPLRLLQAPYRLLGFTAVGAAPLIGGLVLAVQRAAARWSLVAAALVCAFLVLSATHRLPPYSDSPAQADFTVRGMMYREQIGGDIGTTWLGEFLPKWMQEDPTSLPQPAQGTPGVGPLPASLLVEVERWEPLSWSLGVVAGNEQTVVFRTFYYPSWQAEVDDRPVETFATGRAGLLGVRVPAGSHRVQVWMTATPAARGGSFLSWMCAIALLGWTVRSRRQQLASGMGLAVWHLYQHRRVALVGMALLLALGLVWVRLRPCPNASLLPPFQVGVTFGDEVVLAAADWPRLPAEPGMPLPLRLYWLALSQPEELSAFVHLVTLDGAMAAQADGVPVYGFAPTSRWVAGELVAEERAMDLPTGLADGLYLLQVGLVQSSDRRRLPITATSGANGRLRDEGVIVGKVTVGMDAPPADAVANGATFGDAVALVAGRMPPSVAAGGLLDIGMWWNPRRSLETDYTVFVHLVSSDGIVVAQQDSQPHAGRYPTTWWDAGEVVHDRVKVSVPSGTAPGSYAARVGLYELATMRRLPVGERDYAELGRVEVMAPSPQR